MIRERKRISQKLLVVFVIPLLALLRIFYDIRTPTTINLTSPTKATNTEQLFQRSDSDGSFSQGADNVENITVLKDYEKQHNKIHYQKRSQKLLLLDPTTKQRHEGEGEMNEEFYYDEDNEQNSTDDVTTYSHYDTNKNINVIHQISRLESEGDDDEDFRDSRVNRSVTTVFEEKDSTTALKKARGERTNYRISHTKNELPHLVFHVGPPKTATTSLQLKLADWNLRGILLKESNYLYIGKVPDFRRNSTNYKKYYQNLQSAIRDISCHQEMASVRQRYFSINNSYNNSNIPLHEALLQLPCAEKIVTLLQPLSHNGTNVLISEELMSRGYRQWVTANVPKNSPNQSSSSSSSHLDWHSLAVLLQSLYDITVIVGYRRYYEWLPSVKQQIEKYDRSRIHWSLWPTSTSVNRTLLMSTKVNVLEVDNLKNYSDFYNNSNRIEGDDFDTFVQLVSGLPFNKKSRHNKALMRSSLANPPVGLPMEPLFPEYWKRVKPGQIVLSPNYKTLYTNEFNGRAHSLNPRNLSLKGGNKSLHSIGRLDFWAHAVDVPHHYTDTTVASVIAARHSLQQQQSLTNLKVVVFNVHDLRPIPYDDIVDTNNIQLSNVLQQPTQATQSLHTAFFCNNVLPAATNLCKYSTDTDRMMHRQLNNEKEYLETANPTIFPSTQYDQLVTAAYDLGLIVDSHRPYHRRSLQQRQLQQIQQQQKENDTSHKVKLHRRPKNYRHSHHERSLDIYIQSRFTSRSTRPRYVLASQEYHMKLLLSLYNITNVSTTTSITSQMTEKTKFISYGRNRGAENYGLDQSYKAQVHALLSAMSSNTTSPPLSSIYEFVWVCPEQKELELFLEHSLKYERMIVPIEQYNETEFRIKYWIHVTEPRNKYKYCSVDSKKTLEQPHWIDFFSTQH